MSSRLFKHQMAIRRNLGINKLPGMYLALGSGVIYKVDTATDSLIPYANLAVGGSTKIVFSPDNRHIYYAFGQRTNWAFLYRHDGKGNFVQIILPDAPSNIGEVHSVDWSKDGKYLFIGIRNSPSLLIYRLNADDSWTRMPDLSPSLPSSGYSVQFNPKGDVLAISFPVAPYVRFFKYNGANGSLTAMPDPSPSPGTYSYEGIAWVEDYVAVYAKENYTSPDAFRISVAANTVTTLTTTGLNTGANWVSGVSSDGKYLMFAQWANNVVLYARYNGGTNQLDFTPLTLPSGLPGAQARGVGFSPDGKYAAIGYADTALAFMARSGDVLTKLTVPAQGTAVYDVVFSN